MEADERDTMDWDIRHDIAEIPTKRDEVKFTFDLALAHKVKELRAGDDEKAWPRLRRPWRRRPTAPNW